MKIRHVLAFTLCAACCVLAACNSNPSLPLPTAEIAAPTLPPDPTPTSTPEPTPTPVTPLPGVPVDWLPDLTQSNPSNFLADAYDTTNEQVAASRPDAAEHLQRLQEWGRETGSVRWFVHQQGCGFTTGVRETLLQAVMYQTIGGAQSAFDYSRAEDAPQSGYTPLEGEGFPGSAAYLLDGKPVDACSNAGESVSVRVLFLRANSVGIVQVSAARDALSSEALKEAALEIARQMDAKMLGN